jgi:uncharacterized protein
MNLRVATIVALLTVLPVGGLVPAPGAGPVTDARQPAAARPAFDPVQQATFRIFLRGTPVGDEQASVTRDERGWLISSTSRLAPPIDLRLDRAEIRYADDWAPLSLVMEGSLGDQRIFVETTIASGNAISRYVLNDQTHTKTDPVSPNTLLLPNNFYAAYAALAVRSALLETGAALRLYVAPQTEVTATVRRVTAGRVQTPGRTFTTRQVTLSVQNPGGPLDVEVWAEENGRLVRVSVPAAALDVVREDVASVAARQETFHREGDEDVRVPAAGFTIAATMSRPREARPAQRLPAIVLVPGSGRIDRDETVAGIPVFGQLSSALADAGYLVVRYDKRGVGQSGGREESATLDDYAEDVRAVVRFLSRRRDVNPRNITVVGHSEGGWVGLLAASREKRIARLVLLATPGIAGEALILEQQHHALGRSTLDEAEKEQRVELQKKIHAAVLSGTGWQGIPDPLRRQADTPWFASLLAFDPARVMPRVRQPLLIVQPELDRQVPAHHAARLAELARARRRQPAVEVVSLPGVNHLFVRAKTGEVDEYAMLEEKAITPELPQALSAWLAATPATR